ncbi:hypothetical protein BT69DRAFT_1328679 [Atractiella rhizophila]|nr:hypothetical protein BT69DRAFT_1328679 [Atractiella rhizophila]
MNPNTVLLVVVPLGSALILGLLFFWIWLNRRRARQARAQVKDWRDGVKPEGEGDALEVVVGVKQLTEKELESGLYNSYSEKHSEFNVVVTPPPVTPPHAFTASMRIEPWQFPPSLPGFEVPTTPSTFTMPSTPSPAYAPPSRAPSYKSTTSRSPSSSRSPSTKLPRFPRFPISPKSPTFPKSPRSPNSAPDLTMDDFFLPSDTPSVPLPISAAMAMSSSNLEIITPPLHLMPNSPISAELRRVESEKRRNFEGKEAEKRTLPLRREEGLYFNGTRFEGGVGLERARSERIVRSASEGRAKMAARKHRQAESEGGRSRGARRSATLNMPREKRRERGRGAIPNAAVTPFQLDSPPSRTSSLNKQHRRPKAPPFTREGSVSSIQNIA